MRKLLFDFVKAVTIKIKVIEINTSSLKIYRTDKTCYDLCKSKEYFCTS